MFRKFLITIFLPICILTVLSTSAKAAGIGAYGGFSYMKANIKRANKTYNRYSYFTYWGGGLVFDTAVAKKKLVNYRLNIGLGKLTEERIDYKDSYDYEGWRFEWCNSIGFGIVQLKVFRLWLGPQIGLKFERINVLNTDSRYNMLTLVPAAVLGFNFNIGKIFTISIDGGIRYDLGLSFYYDGNDALSYDLYTYRGPEGFVNLSVIFRINDSQPRSGEKGSRGSKPSNVNYEE